MKILIAGACIGLAAALVVGCSHSKPLHTETITTDSTIIQTVERVRDTTIYLPGDTVSFLLSLPCPDVKIDTSAQGVKVKAKVKLENGTLSVQCSEDSLKLVVTGLREKLTTLQNRKATTQRVEVPVKVPEPYTPKWVWYLVGANVLYLFWRFRNPLFKLFKSFS